MSPRGLVALSDPPTRSFLVPRAAAYLLRAGFDRKEAAALCEHERGDPRLVEVLKAATPPINTTDPLSDWSVATGSYFESLKSSSAFFALLPAMAKLPLNRYGTVTSANPQAAIVGEGIAKLVSKLATAQLLLTPRKASSIVVFTADLVRLMTPGANDLIDKELRGAVSYAVDREFLNILKTGATEIASTGMEADLKAVVDAVDTRGGGGLYWIAGTGAAKAAALTDPTRRASPRGGELLALPMVVTDAADPADLWLVNAGAIAANADGLRLDSAKHATLELSDTPASPPTGATTITSLWQQNLVGMRCEFYFGAVPIFQHVAAVVHGVNWGG